jgi:hypothetical protein
MAHVAVSMTREAQTARIRIRFIHQRRRTRLRYLPDPP